VRDLAPVRFVGRISYSFYLLHVIGLSLALRFEPQGTLALFVLGVLCTIPLAWISWRCVEVPFMRLAGASHVKPTSSGSPTLFQPARD